MTCVLHSIFSQSIPQFSLQGYRFICCNLQHYLRRDPPDLGSVSRSCDSTPHGFLEATVQLPPPNITIGVSPQPTRPLGDGTQSPCVQDDLPKPQLPSWLMDTLVLRNSPLTKLMSVDMRSKEFPNALAKMLASQEDVNTATPLQGDDALDLVDILDQVSKSKIIGVLRLISPHRLLRFRTWNLTSGERALVSFGGSVLRIPSCHVHTRSRGISQKGVTLHSLPEGSQMFGRVATMGIPSV